MVPEGDTKAAKKEAERWQEDWAEHLPVVMDGARADSSWAWLVGGHAWLWLPAGSH